MTKALSNVKDDVLHFVQIPIFTETVINIFDNFILFIHKA